MTQCRANVKHAWTGKQPQWPDRVKAEPIVCMSRMHVHFYSTAMGTGRHLKSGVLQGGNSLDGTCAVEVHCMPGCLKRQIHHAIQTKHQAHMQSRSAQHRSCGGGEPMISRTQELALMRVFDQACWKWWVMTRTLCAQTRVH